MKSVTEFFTHKLVKAIDSKVALLAEGKSPEEIEESIGSAFKLEGDKLKFFFNSMDVATENRENLSRVRVVSIAEGENVPTNAVKVDDYYYLPEMIKAPATVSTKKPDKKGFGKGKRKDGPKPSPWGISPEEVAAKKAAGKKAADKEKS